MTRDPNDDRIADLDKRNALLEQRVTGLENDNKQLKSLVWKVLSAVAVYVALQVVQMWEHFKG